MIPYGRDFTADGEPVEPGSGSEPVEPGSGSEPVEPGSGSEPVDRAVSVRLSDVTPELVRWVWADRLPAGKLVMLDGDPSLGKSTITLDWAARVSTGTDWPDGAPCEAADVVLLSAEDGLADTIRPRLDAAGGDPTRVHALTDIRAVDDQGHATTRPPTLADATAIGELIERTGARLLVIDVLMAYLPGRTDSHRDQDVRAVLHRLADMAERHGCCVVLLRHLRKQSGGSPLYAGGGSIGIIGAARAGYVVAPDPDADDGRLVLAATKSNLAPMPASWAYRLVSAPGTHVARVEWIGQSAHGAGALLAEQLDDDEHGRTDEAKDWLRDYLGEHGGEAIAGTVIRAACAAGIAKRTLQRARQALGVPSRKGSLGGGWVWALPPKTDTERDRQGGVEGADDATRTCEGAEDANIPGAMHPGALGIFDTPEAPSTPNGDHAESPNERGDNEPSESPNERGDNEPSESPNDDPETLIREQLGGRPIASAPTDTREENPR